MGYKKLPYLAQVLLVIAHGARKRWVRKCYCWFV